MPQREDLKQKKKHVIFTCFSFCFSGLDGSCEKPLRIANELQLDKTIFKWAKKGA